MIAFNFLLSFLDIFRTNMALVNLGQPFPSSPSGWLNDLEELKAAGLFLDASVACYDSSRGHTQRDQNPFRTHLCVLAAAGNEFFRSVLMEHHQQNQVRLTSPAWSHVIAFCFLAASRSGWVLKSFSSLFLLGSIFLLYFLVPI